MIEQVLIFVLFVGAAVYLFNLVKKSFSAKPDRNGCAKGCGSCQATPTINKDSQKEVPAGI